MWLGQKVACIYITPVMQPFGRVHTTRVKLVLDGLFRQRIGRTDDLISLVLLMRQAWWLGFIIQIYRKICVLGCVTHALVRAWFTQPSPHIFLHFCTSIASVTFPIFIFILQTHLTLKLRTRICYETWLNPLQRRLLTCWSRWSTCWWGSPSSRPSSSWCGDRDPIQ